MQTLREYMLSFIGLPYRWGGDDPIDGMDCSGLVQEFLLSVGIDPPGDQTAQALYDHFSSAAGTTVGVQGLGVLAFYGKSVTQITHVAMMLDAYRIIEAGGGGSKTVSRKDAADQNAYVRIRLLKHRRDLVALLKPSYASIGVP